MARTDRNELANDGGPGGEDRSKLVDWAPQIIIAAVVIVFIAANTGSVKISYVVGDVEMPLWLALAGVALLAGAAGWFLGRRRLKRAT